MGCIYQDGWGLEDNSGLP